MTGVTVYTSTDAPAIAEWTPSQVQIREKWTDDWETVDYLQVLYAVEAVAPGMSRAQFMYRYGEIKREDQTAFADVEPLSLTGQFIRIRVIPGGTIDGEESKPVTLWTGVVVAESFDMMGTDDEPAGDQGVQAMGLEFLLDRHVIGKAWAANDEGDAEIEIGWAPVFNERYRRGESELGNKGTASGATAGVFGGEDTWSFKDIAEYMLARFSPPDLTFELSGQTDPLGDAIDVVNQEGLTPRQVLNRVVSAHRGMGWCVRVDDEADQARIHVYTLVENTITFGGKRLPANGEKASMAFDDARDIAKAVISVDEAARYDEVLVEGARVRSCFTLSFLDGTLVKGWADAWEESYIQFDTGDAAKNDLYRAEDAYWRVWQFFRPPDDWDWKVNKKGDGAQTKPGESVVPYIDDDGKVKEKNEDGEKVDGAHFRQGKGFLRSLPLERSGAGMEDTEPEYLPPFAVIEIPSEGGSSASSTAAGKTYAYTDRMGAGNRFEAGYLRMVDRELAIHIDTRDNHELAKNHWSLEEGDPGDTERMPQLDYTTISATVNLETDERLKVRAKIRETDDDGDPARVLVVHVPDAHLWHIVKNTITGLSEGQIDRQGAAEQLRDDSDRLRAIAAWCKGWYGEARARVRLDLQKIFLGLRVGTLVTNASSSWHTKKVGTVVTERAWSFGDRPGDRPSTRIRTDYGEPNPALMG